MDKRDWKQFVAIISAADENAEKPRSKEAIALMFEVLKDFDIGEVARAVHHLLLASPYRIKPADIARTITGSSEEKSALAWQIFKRAIERHGSFDSVAFGDPATHWAIIRMGGWERVAREYEQLTDRELNFREKDFRQLYERGLSVATFDPRDKNRELVPRSLQGECERNNRELCGSIGYLEAPTYDIANEKRLDPATLEPVEAKAIESGAAKRPALTYERVETKAPRSIPAPALRRL